MVVKPGEINSFICPRCQRPFQVAIGNSDVIHVCDSGNATLDNEDRVVLGNWTDNDGTSGNVSSNETMTAGQTNKLRGTISQAYGAESVPEVTSRGNRKDTTRVRQHEEFIEL